MQYENRTEEYQKQVEACLSRRYPFVLFNDQENYATIYPAESRIAPVESRGDGPYALPDLPYPDFDVHLQACIDNYEHFHSLVPVPIAPVESVTIAIKNEAINDC